MSLVKALQQSLKKALLGDKLPQRFFMGQQGPQTEVSVWLDGLDKPFDATTCHSMVCAVPFTVCIGFNRDRIPDAPQREHLHLRFAERGGKQRTLGDMALVYTTTIPVPGAELLFFTVKRVKNYCVPPLRLLAFYMHWAYANWIEPSQQDIKPSLQDRRSMEVMFICPSAIGLLSTAEGDKGNIFPLNVMGELAGGYFGFSLKDSRRIASLVRRTKRIAVSYVPWEQGAVAYSLGQNHNKELLEWDKLPFETRPSKHFNIPVPVFTFRVREVEVETIHVAGSHTFFIARIVADETIAQGEEFMVVHGHYQAWRIKTHAAEAAQLLMDDARIKRGIPSPR